MRASTTSLSSAAVTAPVQTLESLRDQLEQRKVAHADAKRAVASSQIVFDTVGDDESLRQHLRAEEAEKLAAAHVARMERRVAAAEAERDAAKRAEIDSEIATLTAELASDPECRKLESEAGDVYSALADALVKIHEHLVERSGKRSRLTSLRMSIDPNYESRFNYNETVEPNFAVIGEQVRARAVGLPSDSPRCRYLHSLAPAKPF